MRVIGLHRLLGHRSIFASVPCRIDCGNTMDIRFLALLLHSIKPVTVNIALELRTTVRLLAFEPGYIKITSSGFPSCVFRLADAPLNSSVGLVAAVLYHFHVDGVHVRISSESPPRSGLGGSGALVVGVIAAVNEALAEMGYRRLNRVQQICLAQNIEEGLGSSRSGLQDQAAAMFGGVNQWVWNYRQLNRPFTRTRLIHPKHCKQLRSNILVAYTGATHKPSGMTQEWLDDFISGRVRREWSQIRESAIGFANALRDGNWALAAKFLNEECQLRVRLWPSALDTTGQQLVESAVALGCGARFCGGGGGGCVWAMGEEGKIIELGNVWRGVLAGTNSGRVLTADVAPRGVIVGHEYY